MTDPASLELDLTQAVRARRREKWRHSATELARPLPAGSVRYEGDSLEVLRETIEQSGRGFMIVSMHHSDYLGLLRMPQDLGVDFLVGGNGQVELFLRNSGLRFDRVTFTEQPSLAQLRECREGRLGLFFMVDARLGRGSEMLVPFRGKAEQVTAFWADLAVKLRLHVLVVLARRTLEDGTILTHLIRRPAEDSYRLACQVFATLDRMIGPDMAEWEDEKLWALRSDLTATLDAPDAGARLAALAACDVDVAMDYRAIQISEGPSL